MILVNTRHHVGKCGILELMTEQVWFTRDGAARYLRVSTRTLDRWIATGKLVTYRQGRKVVRLRREDLDDFMMGGTGDSS